MYTVQGFIVFLTTKKKYFCNINELNPISKPTTIYPARFNRSNLRAQTHLL